MRRLGFAGLVLAGVALVAGACGGGSGEDVDREVTVVMRDTAFEPATLTVSQGETVRFRFRNDGKVPHDAYIGDERAQAAHEKEMRAGDGDDHDDHGEDADAVTVAAGKSGSLDYTFTEPGETIIGCHQPGHYDGGMRIAVRVRAR